MRVSCVRAAHTAIAGCHVHVGQAWPQALQDEDSDRIITTSGCSRLDHKAVLWLSSSLIVRKRRKIPPSVAEAATFDCPGGRPKGGKMLSYVDCEGMSDLKSNEIAAIARYLHVPEIVAVE